MNSYKHILLAADYTGHSESVALRAKDLAEQYQAKLSIIHVLDDIPMPDTTYGTVISLDEDSSDERLETAKKSLQQIADQLDVDKENRWLVWGRPTEEIIRIAEQGRVDLIVAGSHGRHGLALLLGSTANGLLHHAKCDLIAVRLEDD